MVWPFKRRIRVLRVEDRAPGTPVCTYVVEFDFLDYPVELHYPRSMGEKDVKRDIEETYRVLKRSA